MIRWLASLISRLKRSRSKVILTAGFFIFNPDGKILICKPCNSNHWTIPKGKLEPHETALTGALRETFEETGLSLAKRNGHCYYVGTQLYKHGTKRIHAFAYLLRRAASAKELHCISKVDGRTEIVAYEFVTLRKASEMLPQAQAALVDKIVRGNFDDLPQIDVYLNYE